MYKTAGTVWKHLWVFRVDVGQGDVPTARQNIIVLATDADVSGAELLKRISGDLGGRSQVRGLADMGADLYAGMVEMGDVPVMTDAYAPTDSLIQLD